MARETTRVRDEVRRHDRDAARRSSELYRRVVELLGDPATRVVELRGAGPNAEAGGRVVWHERAGGLPRSSRNCRRCPPARPTRRGRSVVRRRARRASSRSTPRARGAVSSSPPRVCPGQGVCRVGSSPKAAPPNRPGRSCWPRARSAVGDGPQRTQRPCYPRSVGGLALTRGARCHRERDQADALRRRADADARAGIIGRQERVELWVRALLLARRRPHEDAEYHGRSGAISSQEANHGRSLLFASCERLRTPASARSPRQPAPRAGA